MALGFPGVKEQYLDDFADAFSASGLDVLVFDFRNFGTNEEESRQEIDPVNQIRGYQHAFTYACFLHEIDAGA